MPDQCRCHINYFSHHTPAFDVVALKEKIAHGIIRRMFCVQYHGKPPSEAVSVLGTCVETLPAVERVNMRRVPGEKHTTRTMF